MAQDILINRYLDDTFCVSH